MTGPLKSTNLSQKICSARAFPFSRLHRWRFFHFPLYFRKKRHSFSKELLAQHISTCVADDLRAGSEAKLDELVNLLPKLMK